MTVLVDTGVLYAEHDTDAARHDRAAAALDAVYDDEFGLPYVSDYIYDEAVTLTLKRGESFAAAKRLGERLRGEDLRTSAPGCTRWHASRPRCSGTQSNSSSATTTRG